MQKLCDFIQSHLLIVGIISHAIGILLRNSLNLEGVSSTNFRVSNFAIKSLIYLDEFFVWGLRLGSSFIFSFLSVDIQSLLKRQSFLMYNFDIFVRS